MTDSSSNSLVSGGSSARLEDESSLTDSIFVNGKGKDRVPVHQPQRSYDEDGDDCEETPRAQTMQNVAGFQRGKVAAVSGKKKAAARKQGHQTLQRIKGKDEPAQLRPRGALEAGVSIDELFYRTFAGMKKSYEQNTRELRFIEDERRAAIGTLRHSIGENAMWYTSRQAAKPDVTPSRRTKRSLCTFKAAAAFLMLHAGVSKRRKAEHDKQEQGRRRASQEEADRLMKTEEDHANRATRALVDVLAGRLQAEKDWLSARERQRRKPLTDLIHSKNEADQECRSWPDCINELQAARKEAKQIEKKSEQFFSDWWQRSREACVHVWPGDDNPFTDLSKSKARDSAPVAVPSQTNKKSPSRHDNQRTDKASRVTWSGHGKRPNPRRKDTRTPIPAETKKVWEDLPDLIELFRVKLFDNDGDMSYKTFEFLKRSKAKHVADAAKHTEEANELEKEFQVLSQAADTELVPYEAKHAAELAKMQKQLQAEEDAAQEPLVQPLLLLGEKEAELQALQAKRDDLTFTVEAEEASLQEVYVLVHDLDAELNTTRQALSAERQKLRQLLASRRAANALNQMADYSKEGRREHMLELEGRVEGLKSELAERAEKRASQRRMMLQLKLEAMRYAGGFGSDTAVWAEYRRLVPVQGEEEVDRDAEGSKREGEVARPLSTDEVYGVVTQYVDAADEFVSLAEAKAHVHIRFPWIKMADWETELESLYDRAFDEEQLRVNTITPEEEMRLVRLELSDYGYAEDEMEGFSIEELKAMLEQEKHT